MMPEMGHTLPRLGFKMRARPDGIGRGGSTAHSLTLEALLVAGRMLAADKTIAGSSL